MITELNVEKIKREYPEILNYFSSDFLEIIFSKETSSKIAEICAENKIEESEKIEKVAYITTLILLRQIPKKNFAEVLINGVGLNPVIANQISFQIDELIFSQFLKIKADKVERKKDKPIIAKVLGF